MLDKQHVNILKYLYTKPRRRKELLKKFKKYDISDMLEYLCQNHYISNDEVIELDSRGFAVEPNAPMSDNVFYYIETSGRIEVEGNQFFDFKFIICQILVPVLVGVLSSVIATMVIKIF